MKTEETILVNRICQGDLEAFHEVVELYKKKIIAKNFGISENRSQGIRRNNR